MGKIIIQAKEKEGQYYNIIDGHAMDELKPKIHILIHMH